MDPPAIEREWSHPSSWAGLIGLWTFEGPSATYRGPQDPDLAHGISITDLDFRGGVFGADVTLDKPEAAGRLVFGHEAETGAYYSAGVGGGAAAYVLDQFVPGRGWITIAAHGASANLEGGRSYSVDVYLYGQLMWLEVDNVEVLRAELPRPLTGHHVGAIAWSSGELAFADVRILRQRPEAFVVMQFGAPYDDLYADVIVPTCSGSRRSSSPSAGGSFPSTSAATGASSTTTPSAERQSCRTALRATSRTSSRTSNAPLALDCTRYQ